MTTTQPPRVGGKADFFGQLVLVTAINDGTANVRYLTHWGRITEFTTTTLVEDLVAVR